MAQTRFAPTLFERLFDEQPGSPADHLIRGWSLEQLKDSVATDVEALLNSRCAFPPARLADYREARSSVLDRKSTRLNSSHHRLSRMPSSA